MKGSMHRVHRGGPWTLGPCFVYVPKKLLVRALKKLLKTQAGDISPYVYENSLILHVSNIRAKVSCHCQGTSKNS